MVFMIRLKAGSIIVPRRKLLEIWLFEFFRSGWANWKTQCPDLSGNERPRPEVFDYFIWYPQRYGSTWLSSMIGWTSVLWLGNKRKLAVITQGSNSDVAMESNRRWCASVDCFCWMLALARLQPQAPLSLQKSGWACAPHTCLPPCTTYECIYTTSGLTFLKSYFISPSLTFRNETAEALNIQSCSHVFIPSLLTNSHLWFHTYIGMHFFQFKEISLSAFLHQVA